MKPCFFFSEFQSTLGQGLPKWYPQGFSKDPTCHMSPITSRVMMGCGAPCLRGQWSSHWLDYENSRRVRTRTRVTGKASRESTQPHKKKEQWEQCFSEHRKDERMKKDEQKGRWTSGERSLWVPSLTWSDSLGSRAGRVKGRDHLLHPQNICYKIRLMACVMSGGSCERNCWAVHDLS